MSLLESQRKQAPLADLMAEEVVTCSPVASLSEAARKMWEHDLGFVVVLRQGERRPVGVLTDRDVCMAAYTQGRRLSEIPVHTAMARLVHSVPTTATVEEVHALMRDKQLRRVPVVDGNGELVGVVGLADLALGADDAEGTGELAKTMREVTRRRGVFRVAPDPIC